MKVEEYIASGILEAYVLGSLNLKEIQEVEQMAMQYPEVKNEIISLQTALESYAESIAVKPRPDLKKNILEKIQNSSEPGENQSALSYYRYATAASVALMIVCGSLAYYYWSKWQGAEQRLVGLEEQAARYAEQINKASYQIDQLAENFAVLSDTSVIKVTMKGVPNSPGSLAVVFWNKNTNEVFINPGNLPKAPEGMQYQLWALQDGKPVDAGVFETANHTGIQKVKNIPSAQAYAVTLEKKGGSKEPTLTAMFVFGEV